MRNLTTKFDNSCLYKKLLYSVMDEATLFKARNDPKTWKIAFIIIFSLVITINIILI